MTGKRCDAFLCRTLVMLCVCCTIGQTAPPDTNDFATTLAVQTALRQGKEFLLDGQYQQAVRVLESQVSRINGNGEYLRVLRDAYRELIKQLLLDGKREEAKRFIANLEIIQPGASGDLRPGKAPSRPTIKETTKTNLPKPIKVRGKIDQPESKIEKKLPLHQLATLPEPPSTLVQPDAEHVSKYKDKEKAEALLIQAEKQFREKNYVKAAQLYAEAHRLSPEVVSPSKHRWAYCQLYEVVQLLNQKDSTIPVTTMSDKVRKAITLSPKLEPFGNKILLAIAQREGTPAATKQGELEVQHTQPAGSKWAIAESANFRIYHTQSRDYAERVAHVAEKTRSEQQSKWFGKVSDKWKKSCEIYLHPSADEYSRHTRIAKTSPGHATIERRGSQILSRRIHLRLDHRDTLTTVLPHETTHVVLAGRFGPFDIPRWADEGMAVSSEPETRRTRFAEYLSQARRDGRLFRLRQLLQMENWPQDAADITLFYAQSLSVVAYLVKKKDSTTFAQFLDASMDGNVESNLRKFYGYQSFEQLQENWLTSISR